MIVDLAWPLAAVCIIIVFLVFFRDDIRALLRRVRQVPTPFGPLMADQEVPDNVEGFVARETYEEARTELEASSKTAEQWKQLATEYWTTYWYEQAYRQIYGTQLKLLQDLNVRPHGATADELDGYYQGHLALMRASYPTYHISREQFLSFLESAEFIEQDSYRYVTTVWGQGFLQYLTRARIPLFKPY